MPAPLLNVQSRFIGGRDGKRLRTATFDAAPGVPRRGVCVLLSGQTEFIEKYVEVVGELTGRGFAVAALDWRGQGGSRRELADPLKVHVGDFAGYDEDLAAFMDMVVRPMGAGPPLALAHSMGGHILLRALHAQPARFAGAILSAPMIGMQTRGYPAPVARAMCRVQNALGHGADWVWGMKDRDPLGLPFSQQMVTSDAGRYARTQQILAAHPDLRTAGPTWGWLEAAFRSVARSRAAGYAETISTPLLVLGAGRDRIVETAATAAFARKLPRGRYIEVADAEHELLMENDSVRARVWDAFDRFAGEAL